MSRPEYSRWRARVTMAVCVVCQWTAIAVHSQPSTAFRQKTRTFHSADNFARTTGGRVRIQRQLDPQQEAALRRLPVHLPLTDFTVIGVESPAVTWIGTPQGAIRLG